MKTGGSINRRALLAWPCRFRCGQMSLLEAEKIS
jgi:hypothetical protein